jgi:hypothetical protein
MLSNRPAGPQSRRSKREASLNLSLIRRKLDEAQSSFLRSADKIPTEKWNEKTSAKEWSAAEITAHLIMIERAIISAADHITIKSPRTFPLWKRVHVPLWFAGVRLVRLKSPIPVDPKLLGAKEELLGELRLTRERSFAFLAETEKRDLSAYRWRHPFLGRLNTYEWFQLIAAHQLRHTKQMKDLSRRLPKVVESSQIQ